MSSSDFELLAAPDHLHRIGVGGEHRRCPSRRRPSPDRAAARRRPWRSPHRTGTSIGRRGMPAIGMLPELNRSSPICTTFSPTAWVMLLALICSVPERCRRDLQFAIGRLLDFFGEQFRAARGREVRRRLMHIEIPQLGCGCLFVRCDHSRQTYACRSGNSYRRPPGPNVHAFLPMVSASLDAACIASPRLAVQVGRGKFRLARPSPPMRLVDMPGRARKGQRWSLIAASDNNCLRN